MLGALPEGYQQAAATPEAARPQGGDLTMLRDPATGGKVTQLPDDIKAIAGFLLQGPLGRPAWGTRGKAEAARRPAMDSSLPVGADEKQMGGSGR
jgi:hypothetical protein